ncbi:MAG: sigma-70 factor domain-containing protein, partial [Geitlerinemataceae cyanobacterium]
MPGTAFYQDLENNAQLNPSLDELELATPDDIASSSLGMEVEYTDADSLPSNARNRTTTDLVRIYLQEIGKVELLGRDEEVAEAQKVQQYVSLLESRRQAAEDGDELMQRCVHLVEVRDRLTSQLGHRPSLERWATDAGIVVSDLKPTLAEGKRRWAQLAGLTVEALDKIQTNGKRAKAHMIKANLRLV